MASFRRQQKKIHYVKVNSILSLKSKTLFILHCRHVFDVNTAFDSYISDLSCFCVQVGEQLLMLEVYIDPNTTMNYKVETMDTRRRSYEWFKEIHLQVLNFNYINSFIHGSILPSTVHQPFISSCICSFIIVNVHSFICCDVFKMICSVLFCRNCAVV